ncbi:hypothetical protein E5335_07545 [Coriobacteriaceae bacterium]|nr:hypothetical protein E5335_07545 [Coriobacteriaceae bacterium]
MNNDNEPRRSVLNVVLDHPGRSAAAFAALSGVATAAVASLVGCGTDMVVPKVFCLFLVANLCVWTVICEALLVSIHRGRHRPDSIRRYGNTSLVMVLCSVAVGVCVSCAVFTAVPGWSPPTPFGTRSAPPPSPSSHAPPAPWPSRSSSSP